LISYPAILGVQSKESILKFSRFEKIFPEWLIFDLLLNIKLYLCAIKT
jgi:hypothetical protein